MAFHSLAEVENRDEIDNTNIDNHKFLCLTSVLIVSAAAED